MPERRELALGLGLAGVIAAAAWCLGADVGHAILLGAVVTVAGLAVLAAAAGWSGADLGWHFREWAGPAGARDDVAQLAAALGAGWGRVDQDAENRLRRIARGRLALEGLDLRDPADRAAITALIGAANVRTLTREDVLGMRVGAVSACLDALAELDASRSTR